MTAFGKPGRAQTPAWKSSLALLVGLSVWTCLALSAAAAAAVEVANNEPAAPAMSTASAVTAPGVAPTDSLVNSYWGPLPVRSDSVSAVFADRPRPGWEKVVMVPYHVAGLPFRLVYWLGDEFITTLDEAGLFSMPPALHLGLPVPLGFYLMPEFGVDGLEGITYGFNATRYELLGENDILFLSARTSTRHADKVSGGLFFELGDRTDLQFGGGTAELPFTEFYGTGPDSDEDDLSYYNRKSRWGGFQLTHDLDRRFALELHTYYSQVLSVDSGFESQLALRRIHPDHDTFGFPGQSNGWTFKLDLQYDSTGETARPESGSFREASVSYFTTSDTRDLRFLEYRFNVEQYLPLWHTKRTLALRGFFNRISNLGTAEVPLARLVTFSNPDVLRGFDSLRFYGMGSLALCADYRWPIWVAKGRDGPGLDAYLFTDIGQVFNTHEEIALNNLEYTGGFGMRFLSGGQKYLARFEVGFSDEDTVIRLKFSQSFQYTPRGMLFGKDPTRKP